MRRDAMCHHWIEEPTREAVEECEEATEEGEDSEPPVSSPTPADD